MNHYDFAGRVAIVTGGQRGIGAAVVQQLRAGGAEVMIFDLHGDGEQPVGVEVLEVDVTDSAAVSAAVGTVESNKGRLDIAVCCAGVFGASLATVEVSDEEWMGVLAVNLNGTFHVNRAVIPIMSRGGYGRIVNVSSTAGKEGNPRAAAYSAAKAGVMAMTQAVARDVAAVGIVANCVAPAAIETPLMAKYAATLTQEARDYMVQRIPLGRMGAAEEVARLIAFLASEDLSFSTGAVFDVSGGRAAF
jgi:2-dehydro-3-deoxy-L-rhamnonate dehydrogenase (NAD+)